MRPSATAKTPFPKSPRHAAWALASGLALVLGLPAAMAVAEPGGLRVGDCWYADVQQEKVEFRLCITADDFVEGVVIRKDALGPGINEGWPVQARFRVEQGRLQILVPNQPPNWLAAETDPSRTDGCAIAFSRDGQRMTSSDCRVRATWCRHSPQELPPLCREGERRGRQAPAANRRDGPARP